MVSCSVCRILLGARTLLRATSFRNQELLCCPKLQSYQRASRALLSPWCQVKTELSAQFVVHLCTCLEKTLDRRCIVKGTSEQW